MKRFQLFGGTMYLARKLTDLQRFSPGFFYFTTFKFWSEFAPFHVRSVSTSCTLKEKRDGEEKKSLPAEIWSEIFQCNLCKAKEILARHPNVTKVSENSAKQKVDLVTSYKIPIEFVQNNPKFVRISSIDTLSTRLKLLDERGLIQDAFTSEVVLKKDIVLNSLKASSSKFNSLFNNLCKNQDALEGCANRCEYIKYRLNCSQEEAENLAIFITDRGVSHSHLKEKLDFLLLEVKFSQDYLKTNIPTIVLDRSLSTLRRRFDIATEQGHVDHLAMIRIWNLSESEFKKQSSNLFHKAKKKSLKKTKMVTIGEKELENWADVFQCSKFKAEEILTNYPRLTEKCENLAKQKVDLVTSYDIPIKCIQDRPVFIYTSSIDNLSKRLKLLDQRGLIQDVVISEIVLKKKSILTYLEMINYRFVDSFKHLCKNQDALEGCANRCEYIKYRLNCSQEKAEYISRFTRHWGIRHALFKEKLDFFLLEMKFSPEFVVQNIHRIIRNRNKSLASLRERFNIVCNRDEDIDPDTLLTIWHLTETNFKEKYCSGK